jgi:hypothetical protein
MAATWHQVRSRVRVGVRQRDRNGWPPEHVVVLGLEAGDHRIAAADVRHRQHTRRPDEVEPSVGGEAQHLRGDN